VSRNGFNFVRHSLYQERAQQLTGMDNIAATFTMGIDDPAPTISGNGAAIAPRPASSTELVSDEFPVFHWRHDCRISFHRFRDLVQGDTGTGDERFKQDVAWMCAKPLTAQGAMNPHSVSRFIVDRAHAILLKMGLSSHSDPRSP
jgi:hypothetical protein